MPYRPGDVAGEVRKFLYEPASVRTSPPDCPIKTPEFGFAIWWWSAALAAHLLSQRGGWRSNDGRCSCWRLPILPKSPSWPSGRRGLVPHRGKSYIPTVHSKNIDYPGETGVTGVQAIIYAGLAVTP